MKHVLTFLVCVAWGLIPQLNAQENNEQVNLSRTLDALYPTLTSGVFKRARVEDLPDGVIVQAGDIEFADQQLRETMDGVPASIREHAPGNEIYFVEQSLTPVILAKIAREWFESEERNVTDWLENEIVGTYFNEYVFSDISVSQTEVVTFYTENSAMFGGAPLDAVKSQLYTYLLEEKQRDSAQVHIAQLGDTHSISLSRQWVLRQAPLALDNAVDQARSSGIPSVVDFGRGGCRPCDMMTPILNNLRERFTGKANVLFIHVNEHPVLTRRYGIQSIPVQIFFDANGKETYRHTGYFPMDQMEVKMAEAGVVIQE